MAVFTSSVFALRKKLIMDALVSSGAKCEETAKTLKNAGVVNPDSFEEYTEKLAEITKHKGSDTIESYNS